MALSHITNFSEKVSVKNQNFIEIIRANRSNKIKVL